MISNCKNISSRLRTLGAATVLLSFGFLYASAANAQGVTVYKGGKKADNTLALVRSRSVMTAPFRFQTQRSRGQITDVAELLGGNGGVSLRVKKKREAVQYCRNGRDEICVVRGSRIVYVARRKN